ncbi:4Fe-4S dicluster domain-containing protein [Candidatus Chloroploca sp. M-50]|uniref:4Fe-4S dicluster domain-containing protein n=1 Tax=Candidatus Chloroploca mongolica TaxID=2528176 RepID=A0ABS4DCT5_9CHLR|nr:4Fe-4S dicluster domain-containing protein [Candidatus Chloroploca mongolica]MBP1467129.1 4Fe-4S dicluster domain-containing protein [Candidatus Chloroploca mongolica]
MTITIQRGEVVEVARGSQRRRAVPGMGLLDSLGVVWKHWRESFRQNRDFSDIHGTFTEQYPDERPNLPEAYRNMPILLFDDETGHEFCTSCFQCQRICPPQVIHMTQAKDTTTGKAVPSVAEFIIEYDACMSCGFCAEVCPFDAIKMDHHFELSTSDHASLTVHKQELNRPVSYYQSIAPTLWEEAKAGAYKKLQGNIKRRPDVIGIAPHLVDRIAARRAELAAAAAAAPPPPPTAPAAPPAAAPPAEARKLTPEEKAAKLAAIKAANTAKQSGATPAETPPAAAELSPAEAKAAKLAAIRAANTAKQAGTVPAAEVPPAPVDEKAAKLAAIRAANAAKQAGTAPAAEVPPAEPAPVDEKAAKLAAIRAANAAKKAAAEDNETERN